MMRRRPVGRLLGMGTAIGLLACTELPSDPDVPIAIAVVPPELPALVRGDTLRDAQGNAVPLEAHALNSDNDVIVGAPITFSVIDTGDVLTIHPQTGVIVGTDTGTARVVASVGDLQSAPITIVVTLPPDTLTPVTALRDTLQFLIGRDSRLDLTVRLGHDTTPAVPGDPTVPVRSYPVHFEIVEPAGLPPGDTTVVTLVNQAGRPSQLDTTDASGQATRAVRLSPAVRTAPPDSIIVEARASRSNGTPVPGSPVRFIVTIRP